MSARLKLVDSAPHQRFEFDYNRNAVFFESKVIHLSPHESDILHLLLMNRARVVPLGTMIERVYGAGEPETAPVSIRVAVHSLRKKLADTGIRIRAEARVGYEIDMENVPEMNLGLKDRVLSALNVARAVGHRDAADRLQAVLRMVESEAIYPGPEPA
jgi:DNA-binding winged helix-turn-helix (wHTH) protein